MKLDDRQSRPPGRGGSGSSVVTIGARETAEAEAEMEVWEAAEEAAGEALKGADDRRD